MPVAANWQDECKMIAVTYGSQVHCGEPRNGVDNPCLHGKTARGRAYIRTVHAAG